MQDPTAFQVQPMMKPHFPEQEQLKCPRCDSTNTKFCYYNNYNLSQPRHFCKNCRRYWTKGGALRNIPVGGGSRKNTKRSSSNANCKRSASSSTSPSPSISSASSAPQASAPAPEADPTRLYSKPIDQDRRLLNIGNGGGFSSLLASTGHMGLGSLLEGLNSSGSSSSLKMVQMQMGEFGENAGSGSGPLVNSNSGRKPSELEMQMQSNGNSDSERFLGLQNGDSGCWNGNNGWSNLAIYTPGSSFQ